MDITPLRHYYTLEAELKPQTAHWLEMAEYDLGAAEAMFKSRRYIYVIFFCHLCLEKALKGCVTEVGDIFPPRTHNLTKLLQVAGLDAPESVQEFINKLSELSVTTRYPDSLGRLQRAQSKEYLDQAREVLVWLRQRLTSSA